VENKNKRLKPLIEGAEVLSLGISMVVAILTGVLIGMGLKHLFHQSWLLWVGVFIGIAAAILNVYKIASKQYKEFEEMSKSPKYQTKRYLNDNKEEEDEEDDDTKGY